MINAQVLIGKVFPSLQHAERSLLYFRNLKKNSKYARQQIENDMETLRCNCKNEDDLTWDDFSKFDWKKSLHNFSFTFRVRSFEKLTSSSDLWDLPHGFESVLRLLRDDEFHGDHFRRIRLDALAKRFVNHRRRNSDNRLNVSDPSR